jgi:hypothetical protein
LAVHSFFCEVFKILLVFYWIVYWVVTLIRCKVYKYIFSQSVALLYTSGIFHLILW